MSNADQRNDPFAGLVRLDLVDATAAAKSVKVAEFVERFSDPCLLIELPAAGSRVKRQFATVTLTRGGGKSSSDAAGERLALAPLRKRGVESPNLVTVGRTQAADICLDDGSISKLHAYFTRDPLLGAIHLVDATSTNGTTVDGKRLTAKRPVKLSGGERIVFGGRFASTYLPPEQLHHYLRKKKP